LDPRKNSPVSRARPLPRPPRFAAPMSCCGFGALAGVRGVRGVCGVRAGESPLSLGGGVLCILSGPFQWRGIAAGLPRAGAGGGLCILLIPCIGVGIGDRGGLGNGLGVAVGVGNGVCIVDAVVLGVAAGLGIGETPGEAQTACMLSCGGRTRDRFTGVRGSGTMPGGGPQAMTTTGAGLLGTTGTKWLATGPITGTCCCTQIGVGRALMKLG